jgi:hypothetical protein
MATALQLIPESTAVVAGAAFLTIRQVSQLTHLSIDTLKAINLAGDGPAFTEDNGRTRYTPEAVRAFQAKRSEAHKVLMAAIGGGNNPDIHGNTVPALVGFASGIADWRRVARISNGLFCRSGRKAQ